MSGYSTKHLKTENCHTFYFVITKIGKFSLKGEYLYPEGCVKSKILLHHLKAFLLLVQQAS